MTNETTTSVPSVEQDKMRTPATGHPSWLARSRILILGTLAIVVAGSALNWPWLTAIGVAPALLSIAPCAVMCALGLCMRGSSCERK